MHLPARIREGNQRLLQVLIQMRKVSIRKFLPYFHLTASLMASYDWEAYIANIDHFEYRIKRQIKPRLNVCLVKARPLIAPQLCLVNVKMGSNVQTLR